ncbi:hypothetical protein RchiOBHm_Chr7g0243811 [Rosa chinensis]|uniref:Uncharacterized protein n=1 Tax=Rosa chinensis TaxID=74649 RepID=A0A2P6PIU0_ROSCH|nr:hypothetical protein RchiOBHm_Chr7g0243811 [Rosa chinensis]
MAIAAATMALARPTSTALPTTTHRANRPNGSSLLSLFVIHLLLLQNLQELSFSSSSPAAVCAMASKKSFG